jgi:hypothetical protein
MDYDGDDGDASESMRFASIFFATLKNIRTRFEKLDNFQNQFFSYPFPK